MRQLDDPVTGYAKAVLSGRKYHGQSCVSGPMVRLACKRHLEDIKRTDIKFDRDKAQRAIDFFPEVLRLSEGEHAGQPFELSPFQAFIVGSIFGWLNNEGYRRFRTAFIESGKGSGKSPLCAGIGLYLLTSDNEAAAEVYAAAVTRDQAKIMFRDAEHMVTASPPLSSRLILTQNNIAYPQGNSYFRAISSEGRSLDGKRVHGALLDEIHEHPNDTVVEKMRAGTKGRRQALILMITNSGWDRTSVCWDRHEYGRKILEGLLTDDSFFAYICALDPDDDPFEDETCWIKANPNLGISIHDRYLREQVTEARGMPSKRNLVARLNFCQWTQAAERWLDPEVWHACSRKFDDSVFEHGYVVAALDLSGSRDLTCLVILVRSEGLCYSKQWYWLPEVGLMELEKKEGVPWTLWRDQGLLRTTPGAAIDEAFVARDAAHIMRQYRVKALAYDRWRIAGVIKGMSNNGIELERASTDEDLKAILERDGNPAAVDWGQGFKDMSPALTHLESDLLNVTLRHSDNPITAMCAANVVVIADDANNRKPTKSKSKNRIDGIVALAMAEGLIHRVESVTPEVVGSYLTRHQELVLLD